MGFYETAFPDKMESQKNGISAGFSKKTSLSTPVFVR